VDILRTSAHKAILSKSWKYKNFVRVEGLVPIDHCRVDRKSAPQPRDMSLGYTATKISTPWTLIPSTWMNIGSAAQLYTKMPTPSYRHAYYLCPASAEHQADKYDMPPDSSMPLRAFTLLLQHGVLRNRQHARRWHKRAHTTCQDWGEPR
jgi:hypothetical protein